MPIALHSGFACSLSVNLHPVYKPR